MACSLDSLPVQVQTVGVKDAQSPLEILVSDLWKDLGKQHTVAVSKMHENVWPASRQPLQLRNTCAVDIDEMQELKRRVNGKRTGRTPLNDSFGAFRNVMPRSSEAIDINWAEVPASKNLIVWLRIFLKICELYL